jgi:hypothetical protein
MTTNEITAKQEETRVQAARRDVGLVVSLDIEYDELAAWANAYILREGLLFRRSESWQTEKTINDLDSSSLIAASVSDTRQSAVLFVRDLLVYVIIDQAGKAFATVFSSRYGEGDFAAVYDQLRIWLEPKTTTSDDVVTIGFRYKSGFGLRTYPRDIVAPSWDEIRQNYPEAVREKLSRLAAAFEPGSGGRLVLLYGEPGTGKTYVVRALAREWRAWCKVQYVADPEALLGNADYLMQAMVETASEDKWQLLILEDAGELLARDAKQREGQGLSRLLNLTEGLIGQGTKILVLISTNERLQALNEAVSRPGRTAAEIEFTAFSAEEANAWLAARGRSDSKVTSPATLAELFAMLSGNRITTQPKREPIGFLRR